ncbi:SsrA-binding protein SmpB [Demequina capsici]|uniref:SsrA-binding protein n=1 Tax=Demequina capsici TaxID=3075620 RepID=A0AA96F9C1_9MICO|nr:MULTISPECIES: SsrA-binding protein SmpB [unclassified Demequina]WNM25202.1 SsrA-binding protein SmpB [Demequina sp. OYTSA14]WNM28115.1 SsrA-binding protein SmpB [Demequina sp. PMTSA13]
MGDGVKVIATNRSAHHDYFIDDTFEAGVALMGTEVKSLRMGRATIGEGYVYVDRGEVWAENLHIPEYVQGTWTNHSVRRKRKLLLHAHEIEELARKTSEKGYTIVPLKLYFKGSRVKLEIGLARGKKLHDKRQTLREKQDNREAERAMSLRRARD